VAFKSDVQDNTNKRDTMPSLEFKNNQPRHKPGKFNDDIRLKAESQVTCIRMLKLGLDIGS
jgi:hypothetical protein